MSHILKYLKCRSNLQRHSFIPFLSAFIQDIVSQLPSSSLGDLHLIRSSKNDFFQPAAWCCRSAQHQILLLDFACEHFWKSWINAVLSLGAVWVAKVREQPLLGRVQMKSVIPMWNTWLEGNIVRPQDKQFKKTPRSREMEHDANLSTMQSKAKRKKTHGNPLLILYNWFYHYSF